MQQSIWGKVWRIIANAILIVLLIVGILLAISLLPLKNNYKILSVMSGSMEPTIPVGGLIVIKPEMAYKINDIITFKTPGSNKARDYTTHRVTEIKDDNGSASFVTKGDANKTEDTETIGHDSVIGKELFSIALLGYLLGYIKTLPGLILIVVVPAVIIVYEEVNKIKHEAKMMLEQRRKKREAKKNEGSKKIIKDIKPAKKITKAKKKKGQK